MSHHRPHSCCPSECKSGIMPADRITELFSKPDMHDWRKHLQYLFKKLRGLFSYLWTRQIYSQLSGTLACTNVRPGNLKPNFAASMKTLAIKHLKRCDLLSLAILAIFRVSFLPLPCGGSKLQLFVSYTVAFSPSGYAILQLRHRRLGIDILHF